VTDLAVETRGLRKVFGDVVAVAGLDLAIPRGQVLGLLGANGSGKTTTIRMLCGLHEPSAGEATVVGFDIRTDAERIRTRIGYMSQRFGLYDDLTVLENMEFYSALYGLRGNAQRVRLEELVREMGFGGRLHQLTGQLSGGWRQRVALACAIAHRPDLLLLDEPTAGVDPAARKLFWERIYRLAQEGVTILVTTHYMDEAERCERLAVISRGQLLATGTPAEVRAHFDAATLEDVFIHLQQESGELVG
jgi:ABC-2 type transport system ATP-binding protein